VAQVPKAAFGRNRSYDRNTTDGKAIPRMKSFYSVFIRGMALPSVVIISALRGEVTPTVSNLRSQKWRRFSACNLSSARKMYFETSARC